MFDVSDTIAALATARDGSLRGILRVSGPQVAACLGSIFQSSDRRQLIEVGEPTVLSGILRAGELLGEIPASLYWWPTSRSYTRQPTAELHTLGSPPVLDAALARICEAGARLAAPGEFTLRAFLAGRLDLTQAEAVLGVIDARGDQELNTALGQLAGGLARPLHTLRNQLLDLLAEVEAGLDFVEEDLELIDERELQRRLAAIAGRVAQLLDRMSRREVTSGEPTVVLRGWPNVGKSSLFNALVEQAAAIVSPLAGTTRDYVTARLKLADQHVLLIDTAGVELVEGRDELSEASQRATAAQVESARLQLFCLDASRRLNEGERAELGRTDGVPRRVVLTKGDLPRLCEVEPPYLVTSSAEGRGLVELRQAIVGALDESATDDGGLVAQTAVRCRESLRRAAESLSSARESVAGRRNDELIAAELRRALEELGMVVGAVYTDDILDRIFSRFCIGK